MATELQIFDHTFKAAADLSLQQFKIVKLSANAREVNICTAVTDLPLGVLQDKPSVAGRAATVRLIGISKVVAGAAIAVNSIVGPDTQGRAIVTAAGGAIGWALEAAGAAGEIITVLVCGPTKLGA